MNGCGTTDAADLVRSLLTVADCQATLLGREGWHALSGSGLFASLLTGLLVIAVALQGYSLLASGGGVDPADAVRLLARIGIVIALATSWNAYDRVVYRVATEGPAELAGVIFPAAAIDGSRLTIRLANAYDAILASPIVAPATDPQPQGKPAVPSERIAAAMPGGSGLPASSREGAAGLLLISAGGAWIAVRLVLALLLALGPIAGAAALFASSAGFALGWLRALVGTALASLAVSLSVSFELQVLAGPVRAAARDGLAQIPGIAPILWIFVFVDIALIVAAQRMAGGLVIPRAVRRIVAGEGAPARANPPAAATIDPPRPLVHRAPPVPVGPSRALAIARAADARVSAARAVTIAMNGNHSGNVIEIVDTGQRRGIRMVEGALRSAGRRSVSGKRLELGS
ncbi:type IV secretion system protein [Sphingomonas sp. GV3]|uniref:type IV secretion system protein n=1 Tax=Sphingomonas sp. GV3 TaxID=3040671 RepID=UPI00280B2F53|nr:type IV secretion system protein [Sphingomonas sp. GV3]